MDPDGNISPLDDTPAPDLVIPPDFSPNQEIVDEISSILQVHPSWVIQAQVETQKSLTGREQTKEEIFGWVLENHSQFVQTSSSNNREIVPEDDRKSTIKMVVVVNNDLQMSPGKMAAQVAHAAVELYTLLASNQQLIGQVHKWKDDGAKKVVVKCKDTEHLFDLRDEAENAGLKCVQIADAGLTQVASGSVTCLAVFGSDAEVNKITGSLELL